MTLLTPSTRSFLVGPSRAGRRRHLVVGLAGFVVTFVAYALGIFYVSGGLVFIPYHAAVVGMLVSCWVGYRNGGLVIGWVVTYASLLGYHADHAFIGISRRPLPYRISYFLRPDGLAALAVEGVILGSLAFVVGYLLRLGIELARSRSSAAAER